MANVGYQLNAGHSRDLTVRPEPVEGWAVKSLMVRLAHHERLNLKLYRLKWVAPMLNKVAFIIAIH